LREEDVIFPPAFWQPFGRMELHHRMREMYPKLQAVLFLDSSLLQQAIQRNCFWKIAPMARTEC
jgi:hypothetical protein